MPSTLGIVASGVQGFSPLELSPVLWLDASDATTITSSGSPATVSQWNDKSTTGYNLTNATSAAQPTTGANTQNGLNVITFDGTNDRLFKTGSTLFAGTSFTFAIVATPSTKTNSYIAMLSGSSPIAQASLISGYSSRAFESYNDAASLARFTLGPTSNSGYHTIIVTRSGTTMASLFDGASSGSGTWTSASYTWNDVHVGSAFNNSAFSGTNVAEIVVCSAALAGADLTSLSDYLRTKWGTP